ncbi:MAG: L-2-amino-thiazoline-4-carboxylic acid hydrolase [Candidatus Odinarchaeota archaeon]|nr:L-2-amino-thiazoline-4-carboxylic acid hydrolase [Candidatus Odinarchaeota archaeon]
MSEKVGYALDLYTLLYGLSIKTIKEKYGQEAIETLRKIFFERGKELGKQEIKRLNVKDMNAKGYHIIVKAALDSFNIKHKIVELSEEKYILQIFECPHGVRFKNLGAPPEVCDILLELDRGIVERLNPKLEFKLTKHILRGDNYCEYVVKRKS